ncbi:MAG TPA: protein translocase subunit SecDF [Flavobacteriales bacterium]|nr:protein translocase subunit SecDF [Flavobacteriales bacterium]MBK7248631.1 protein translocase subunit SecDF [Flavobacteriales bacterium]HQV39008.1 protein translocase subunit SecDF [Flavobacteriales bacterium]HQW31447.1 protein translocase subunit SecDF [Flavobacteriales bacterium]HQY01353.1 protein translocase subunit SecDF [Flavobacteriales bacterium]
MQNKGALWVFTILLTLACLWQLSFSIFTGKFERNAGKVAAEYADSVMAVPANKAMDHDSVLLTYQNRYIREHDEEIAYPGLGYTYKECKEKEINLGLDLKGGMAVTLEVDIPDLVDNLSGNSEDPAFRNALTTARRRLTSSNKDFITLFDEEFKKAAPNGSLAAIFSTQDNTTMFPRESNNEQVIASLREQAQIALINTEKILRTRIDKFGVAQPSIQKQSLSGRIQIELPGVKDKDRVRNVLQSTANLEFWETFDNNDVYMKLSEANDRLAVMLHPEMAREDSIKKARKEALAADTLNTATTDTTTADSTVVPSEDSLADALTTDSLGNDTALTDAESLAKSPLLNKDRLQLNIMNNQVVRGDVVGYAAVSDTATVNKLLRMAPPKSPDPSQVMKLAWGAKPMRMGTADGKDRDFLALHALRGPRGGKPKLDGSYITDARQDFDMKGDAEVSMQMNAEGGQKWKLMTGENVGKQIAIVLDGYVVSAPNVMGEIPGGRSSITMGGADDRNKQLEEATDLANVLKAGALPAPARIIDETVVGPSLGAENISRGMWSFLLSIFMVMAFMVLYYNGSGWVANVALLSNIFILLGTLASIQASLTLPGIAGIILTVGMAVDANVLINERIREELRHGKAVKTAVDLGYKHALSAILDSNITTFAMALILYFFGGGPVKGFATTLAIGILTSLFTAIFISRLIIDRRLEKGKSLSFWHNWNKNIFADLNMDFMSKRFVMYAVSGVIIIAGLVSMFTRGFNYGVDFSGGRQYVVKFDKPVDVEQVRGALEGAFNTEGSARSSVNVKTYGGSDQVKITTNFMINTATTGADQIVEGKLNGALAQLGGAPPIESRKVDPVISDDIRNKSVWAVGLSLVFIFMYILLRFRNWKFGLGAVLSLVHDALIVMGVYSIFYSMMPFSMEIDEQFIAAILTVIGFSINDTVVVFDRIREYLQDHRRDPWGQVFNKAINSTFGRTINTSLTVLIVLLVIFIFGADSIRGFVFAMLVGIGVGTYSSIFVASAIVVDLHKDEIPVKTK